MSPKQHKIKVGISIGDYNGIGPEIIMKSLKDKSITDFFTPIIFGSGKLFTYQKNIFKLPLNFNYITEVSQAQDDKINMVNLWKDNVNVALGTPTEESTRMAIDSLEAATHALMSGEIDVLVTAPINKEEMMKHGFQHAGHTGYLEEKFGKKGLMFLVTDDLKVAVSTHHIPLVEVAENISKEKAELEKDMDSLEAEEASLESDQQELNKILEENKELLAGLYKTSDKATSEIQNGALESDDIEKAISNYYAEKARLEAERAEQERNNNSNSGGSSSGTIHGDLDISPSGFVWPCPGYYYLTSEWNEDRGSYNHGAIDIADAGIMGADVVAAKEGVVIDSYNGCYHNWGKDGSCGCGGGYGNYVMIAHDGGKMTVYGHLSTTMVYTGQHVYQGQVIGFVGSTGHSTGAHLHFETRLNGVKYNPMTEYQS